MFWRKETEEEKSIKKFENFNNRLKKLIEYKNYVDESFNYHNLFNSLLLKDNEIYCISEFKLPKLEDKNNDCLNIITKTKSYRDNLITIQYHFYSDSINDFLGDIIKQKNNFIEMKKQLNIFGFDITKIEKN
jgi:hypothetical protein